MEVCPGEEQAGDEAGTLGIKDEAARMKVTPPLAVAPLAQEDDMRWNPNDDGIVTLKGATRPITTASMPPATSRNNQVNSLRVSRLFNKRQP